MNQFPNITGQAGVYKTGTPDYVEVLESATALTGRVKFDTRATSDSWADGDMVAVKVYTETKNLIAICSWDDTNKRLLIDTIEDSVGTFTDNEVVSVESVLSNQSLLTALASVANNFVPIGGVFVEVIGSTGDPSADVFMITSDHNGKTLCVTGERWLMISLGLPAGFQCALIQETTEEVNLLPQTGVTLNAGTSAIPLSGANSGSYLYARTSNTFQFVA
jgi:hypothetical protein